MLKINNRNNNLNNTKINNKIKQKEEYSGGLSERRKMKIANLFAVRVIRCNFAYQQFVEHFFFELFSLSLDDL